MVYACLRFIQEWAQPLTLINFVLTGLSSGLILTSALAAGRAESQLLHIAGPAALGVTLLAWVARVMALCRNASLIPRSTLQSATGIRATRPVQKSMGMSAGSFNTREFFHRAGRTALRRVKLAMVFLGITCVSTLAFLFACCVQLPGLLADRWFFFAQARHPQNLYYQVIS